MAAIAAVHTDSELRTLYSNIEDFNLSFFANNSALDAMVHLMTKGSLQGLSYPCPLEFAKSMRSIPCSGEWYK